MIKPKVWLYQNGHITADKVNQRGRMAADLVALIKEAVANGAQIEGYAVDKATVATDKPVEVKRVAADPTRVADVPDMRRDERMWSAHITVDGKTKEIGFRTICNGCGSSLGWCFEESSRVWVDYDREAVVNFKPRN